MRKALMAVAIACSGTCFLGTDAFAQQASANATQNSVQNQADVQELVRQLQMLKVNYAQEVRRLRALDMQVQALQARLAGKTTANPIPAEPSNPEASVAGTSTVESSQAASTTQSAQASASAQTRSVQDVLEQQQNAVFNRKFTFENDLTYNHYDRAELTLNGASIA